MESTRRNVLKFGVLGGVAAAAGLQATGLAVAQARGGSDDLASSTGSTPSRLASNSMPVPFRAVFKRPPELVPYSTGYDPDGQPFAKYSLSQRLGQAQIAPGLWTT